MAMVSLKYVKRVWRSFDRWKGRDARPKNAYYCRNCMEYTISKDLAYGVTPMFTRCVFCGGDATSVMGRMPETIKNRYPNISWYRPKKKEMIKNRNSWHPEIYRHLERGGLIKNVITAQKLYKND